MTEDERDAILLENIKRKQKLANDITVLEGGLRRVSRDIERFSCTLSENPANVCPDFKEHYFKYQSGVELKVNFEAVRKMIA